MRLGPKQCKCCSLPVVLMLGSRGGHWNRSVYSNMADGGNDETENQTQNFHHEEVDQTQMEVDQESHEKEKYDLSY